MAYAAVNGLQLYYEIHGSGRPLVLLHGGLMTIDLSFGRCSSLSRRAGR
jgi:pimeloyl-ACP methyl ester carboxylesterase